jgi:UDP-N-acetyl-2-amino-2-deoxyglucuronate dehydrogenase
MDKNDSVGVIDSYFPDSAFFTEFERLDRYAEKLKRMDEERRISYVSITSPNYLHDAHARFALRVGADAICEKPVVLNPWNLEALREMEKETGKRIYPILQLRLHPAIIDLRRKMLDSANGRKVDIDLTYITSRGKWYLVSWKGDISKSGGIATNIGIHFFDMLEWIFGKPQWSIVHVSEPTKAAGYLELQGARVRWFLSLDSADLPALAMKNGMTTFRSITIGNEEIEFSGGFGDLHTASYEQILKGNGFRLEDAQPSIETVFEIRNAKPSSVTGDYHPLLKSVRAFDRGLGAANV